MRATARYGLVCVLLLAGCADRNAGSSQAAAGASFSGGALGGGSAGVAGTGASASGSAALEGGTGGVNGGAAGNGGAAPGASGSDAGKAGSGAAGAPLATPAAPLINGVQWADLDGAPIQAHGGGIIQVGSDYYWFGENRNPNSTFAGVAVYRSRDLQRWQLVNQALKASSAPELSPANVERPKVVYNATTHQYVMWMHWENGANYGEARAAVASSDTVDGNYMYHGSFRPLADSGVMDHGKPGYMSRDCNLFVDDDGKAYFISATNENTDLNLYELTPDYLGIARLVAVLFKGAHREAPALFKRGATYFLLSSAATGWSPNQARYASSSSLGSGWSALADVGDANTFYSQPTFVLPVTNSAGTDFLYLGDRWAGAWSGRVQDSNYVWQPLSFPSATSLSMAWHNTLSIDVAQGRITALTQRFQLWNQKSGKLLEVQGSSAVDGAAIVQANEGSGTNQAWNLNYDGAGYFRLTNAASSKVLEVRDESTADGGVIDQWQSNDGDHQAWQIVDLGAGAYWLRNKKSAKLLGLAAAGGAGAAPLEQRSAGMGDEQRWRLVPIAMP